MQRTLWLLLSATLLLLTGCARKAYEASPTAYYEAYDDYLYDEMEASAMLRSEVSAGYAPSPAPSAFAPEEPDSAPVSSAEEAPVERMVHYNGWIQLKVTRTDELIEAIATQIEEIGGYVEQRTLTRITARVPVDAFQETFDEVLGMGDVMSKSLTAEDITEAYSAVDLRLKTAKTTRDRLQELLAKAEDEDEKLELLRQIQRLTEEIDRVESQLRVLSGLAAYSRLTIEAVPRQAFSDRSDRIELDGFEFIQSLSPFRRDVAWSGKLLKLDVPEGMVALDDKDHFVAEGPDGAAIWTGRRVNDPQGDATFWAEAVQTRLSEEFESAEISAVGAWQVLRLVEAGADEPYRYLIAFRVDGKKLDMVEIYYPSAQQEERYDDAVRAVLSGGAS